MTPLVIGLAIAGLAWGLAADRISARWPEHLPDEAEAGGGSHIEAGAAAVPPGAAAGTAQRGAADLEAAGSGPSGGGARPRPPRPLDWRTPVVALVGAASLAGVGLRFEEPAHVALFGAWMVVLTLLFATDLDQRLLPDVLTLPLIPLAGLAGLAGWNPLVADGMLWPAVAAAAFPLGLYLLSIPFGPGAIGMGDLKLLVSAGLTLGLLRTFTGIALGAMLSGVVVFGLLALRLIGRRSYIPYGPFLILGTIWAALVSP